MIYLTSFSQPNLEKLFDKGAGELKKHNYKEAIKIFVDLIPKTNDIEMKKLCYVYRAFSYNGLGEFNKSIADLDTAITIDPVDIASYIARGKTKGYIEDVAGAAKDFEYVLTGTAPLNKAKPHYTIWD